MRERERERGPLWRQRDNISELGEVEREGERGSLCARGRKNSSAVSRKRDREPPVYTETGFVSAASTIKRDGKRENEGDREKEARNATAFTTSAFTCYVKFRWDPRYTTRRNGRRSLSLSRALLLSLSLAMLASRPIRISMKVQMTFAAGDRGEISV